MNPENTIEIIVDNIKCAGCSYMIEIALKKIHGVQQCSINVDTGVISITGNAPRNTIATTLAGLGYPERGVNNTALMKAKSYLSCAIGKYKQPKS